MVPSSSTPILCVCDQNRVLALEVILLMCLSHLWSLFLQESDPFSNMLMLSGTIIHSMNPTSLKKIKMKLLTKLVSINTLLTKKRWKTQADAFL